MLMLSLSVLCSRTLCVFGGDIQQSIHHKNGMQHQNTHANSHCRIGCRLHNSFLQSWHKSLQLVLFFCFSSTLFCLTVCSLANVPSCVVSEPFAISISCKSVQFVDASMVTELFWAFIDNLYVTHSMQSYLQSRWWYCCQDDGEVLLAFSLHSHCLLVFLLLK